MNGSDAKPTILSTPTMDALKWKHNFCSKSISHFRDGILQRFKFFKCSSYLSFDNREYIRADRRVCCRKKTLLSHCIFFFRVEMTSHILNHYGILFIWYCCCSAIQWRWQQMPRIHQNIYILLWTNEPLIHKLILMEDISCYISCHQKLLIFYGELENLCTQKNREMVHAIFEREKLMKKCSSFIYFSTSMYL